MKNVLWTLCLLWTVLLVTSLIAPWLVVTGPVPDTSGWEVLAGHQEALEAADAILEDPAPAERLYASHPEIGLLFLVALALALGALKSPSALRWSPFVLALAAVASLARAGWHVYSMPHEGKLYELELGYGLWWAILALFLVGMGLWELHRWEHPLSRSYRRSVRYNAPVLALVGGGLAGAVAVSWLAPDSLDLGLGGAPLFAGGAVGIGGLLLAGGALRYRWRRLGDFLLIVGSTALVVIIFVELIRLALERSAFTPFGAWYRQAFQQDNLRGLLLVVVGVVLGWTPILLTRGGCGEGAASD